MFESILSEVAGTLTVSSALICMGVSIMLGLVIAYVHMKTSKYSKNFIITLSILPLIVQVVIMMVNGNLGTSVAVLGAFSLVRFRSVPGNSREIASIFFAMAIGLAVGMGHILFAITITIIIGLLILVLSKTKILENNNSTKKLKITIPENLDYETIFDDIFNKYAKTIELIKSKTTNMGSMYELTYDVTLNPNFSQKAFMDEIRCRNGNLNVILERMETIENEL